MRPFNPRSYGPTVAPLLAKAGLNELGPGSPQVALREELQALTPTAVAAPHEVVDAEMAACCYAGLWLRFDFPDEAHRVCQDLDTREGSFWHALVHRREPDFANAKYWFRRVGTHPTDARLADAARRLASEARLGRETAFLIDQSAWDALRFVDLCEIGLDDSPPLHTLCRRIQQAEWELLFDYCFRGATAD